MFNLKDLFSYLEDAYNQFQQIHQKMISYKGKTFPEYGISIVDVIPFHDGTIIEIETKSTAAIRTKEAREQVISNEENLSKKLFPQLRLTQEGLIRHFYCDSSICSELEALFKELYDLQDEVFLLTDKIEETTTEFFTYAQPALEAITQSSLKTPKAKVSETLLKVLLIDVNFGGEDVVIIESTGSQRIVIHLFLPSSTSSNNKQADLIIATLSDTSLLEAAIKDPKYFEVLIKELL